MDKLISELLVPPGFGSKRQWTPPFPISNTEYAAFTSCGGHGYTPDGLFHFFGPEGPSGHTLAAWNERSLWKDGFEIDPKWIAVAEDAFGHQFCLRADGSRPVVKCLNVWTGDFVLVRNSFGEFIESFVEDQASWGECRSLYAQLVVKLSFARYALKHLSPMVPPFLGGGIDLEDFEFSDSVANISLTSQAYRSAGIQRHRPGKTKRDRPI